MHVIALAIKDGKLAGGALTNGDNCLPLRRQRFMAHMRAALGLRPDRTSTELGKPTTQKNSMTSIFTSPSKGPRRHEEAESRDAESERRAQIQWATRLAGQDVAPTSCAQPLLAHRLAALSNLFARCLACAPRRPLEPAPRPAMTHCCTAMSAARANATVAELELA